MHPLIVRQPYSVPEPMSLWHIGKINHLHHLCYMYSNFLLNFIVWNLVTIITYNYKLNVYSKLTMTMCSLKLPILDFVQMDFVHKMAENGWLISNIQKKIK